jgi:predicted DNA-binding protein (UPF0278 family)
MENELEAAARQAASALASLSSKEIVETAIHDYESKLRDFYRTILGRPGTLCRYEN